MLKIFPAKTGEDIELVKTLFTEYSNFLKKELHEYANLPWLAQYYQDFEEETANLPNSYRPPEGFLLVAKYERQLAGCVALVKLNEDTCEMKRLFVRPKYQRLGIGRALCEAIIEQAKKAGYRNMRLATALDLPKVLYKSLGFKEIAPFADVPTEIKGVVFMELKLF
jgi:putative acetyltransferase